MKDNKPFSAIVAKDSLPYLLLTISGLSFCFFLGFPFGNHNESYRWIGVLDRVTLWDSLTKQVVSGVETYRPLGMANAWISYKLSGNIYLQQILNWLFAASSFILLFRYAKNKPLFSFLSFLTCGLFFTGYIYLFHIHGVFYGPLQLYVAWLTCVACQRRVLSGKMLALTVAATAVVALYHTFSLPIFCAFLAGYALQLTKKDSRKEYFKLGTALLITLLLAKLILQTKEFRTMQALIKGFFVSYRMTEINNMLMIAALVLSVLTAITCVKGKTNKIIAGTATVLIAVPFIYFQWTVLLLWICICAIKMIIEKKWAIAGLIGATAILPLASGSGSPTYVVFVVMICTFVTASDDSLAIPDYTVIRKSVLVAVVFLFGCLIALKDGIQVPVFSSFSRPILAEEEKTHQLKDIVAWKFNNKQYEDYSLLFYDDANLPTVSTNLISRKNRPVVSQTHFDNYLDFFGLPNKLRTHALYITFGNKTLPGKELIFSVDGKWNGKAYVFR